MKNMLALGDGNDGIGLEVVAADVAGLDHVHGDKGEADAAVGGVVVQVVGLFVDVE